MHPCINHNQKFTEDIMRCEGQLCSDCPFTEKFKTMREKKYV